MTPFLTGRSTLRRVCAPSYRTVARASWTRLTVTRSGAWRQRWWRLWTPAASGGRYLTSFPRRNRGPVVARGPVRSGRVTADLQVRARGAARDRRLHAEWLGAVRPLVGGVQPGWLIKLNSSCHLPHLSEERCLNGTQRSPLSTGHPVYLSGPLPVFSARRRPAFLFGADCRRTSGVVRSRSTASPRTTPRDGRSWQRFSG